LIWACVDASKSNACIDADSVKSLVIRLDDLWNNPHPKVSLVRKSTPKKSKNWI